MEKLKYMIGFMVIVPLLYLVGYILIKFWNIIINLIFNYHTLWFIILFIGAIIVFIALDALFDE